MSAFKRKFSIATIAAGLGVCRYSAGNHQMCCCSRDNHYSVKSGYYEGMNQLFDSSYILANFRRLAANMEIANPTQSQNSPLEGGVWCFAVPVKSSATTCSLLRRVSGL